MSTVYVTRSFLQGNQFPFSGYTFTYQGSKLVLRCMSRSRYILTFSYVNSIDLMRFSYRSSTQRFVRVRCHDSENQALFVRLNDASQTYGEVIPINQSNHKVNEESEDVCVICLEIRDKSTLPCGHSFCEKCIIHTAAKSSKKCPCCRAQFEIENGSVREYSNILECEIDNLKKTHLENIDRLYARLDSVNQKLRLIRAHRDSLSNHIQQDRLTMAQYVVHSGRFANDANGVLTILRRVLNQHSIPFNEPASRESMIYDVHQWLGQNNEVLYESL